MKKKYRIADNKSTEAYKLNNSEFDADYDTHESSERNPVSMRRNTDEAVRGRKLVRNVSEKPRNYDVSDDSGGPYYSV